MEKLFFQLLQIAIGNRKELTRIPTTAEWKELFAMSKKQALTAVAFRGVSKLRNENANGDSAENLPEVTFLNWLGMTAKVAQLNKKLNAECEEVCTEFAHDGVLSVVLKGQSNLVYYPEDLIECRNPGDIDLWCDVPEGVEVAHKVCGGVEKRKYRGMEGVIEYCKQYERCQGRDLPWDRVLYYHCELTSPSGIDIEPHYRPSYLCSALRNHRLQKWFKENEPWGVCDANIDGHTFPILPVSTNAVYQLLHIYKHLFEEGIGLRQLLDYYFVLRSLHIEQGELADRTPSMAQWAEGMGIAVKSNEEIMHTLGRFGMRKFAGAVMWVLAQVFDPRGDKTKTINTPDGSVSVAVSENSSELDLSVTASSTDSVADPVQPSGDKQEINHSSVVSDWQKRWPWMICKPNEEEGRFLLNEIMMAGNFGKYDERIKHGGSQFSHAIEKTKHNLRLLTHYPEEVMWEPVFRVYHWVWRRFELWRF